MHRRKYPNIRVVARTHGYDLYDQRELYGRQFFKPQMDRGLDRLIFISEYGKQYYLEKYHKTDSEKYPLHRLGVKGQGSRVQGVPNKTEFVLVSCSNVVDIKRIELIIEGLALVEEKVSWIHIGDGPLMEQLQNKAQELLGQKQNIAYEWKGAIPHSDVMAFYKSQPVHCFITTSSTEGSPVSIQEALSFGIPIIGTKVSEIPYMVEGNGILLSENPDPQEVAAAIETLCRMDESAYLALCENAYEKFQTAYDADKLHPEMVEDLLHL
jgi:glycosyltransferase involved in cell wall biosynthesis